MACFRITKYIKISVFLFFLCTQWVLASEKHVTFDKQVQQVFSFNPYPDQQARVVNDMLLLIAEGSGKLRAFTGYRFNADLILHIHTPDDNKHLLTIFQENKRISGDMYYRDFSMEHVLTPDRADLGIRITDAAGVVVFEYQYEALSIAEDDEKWLDTSFFYNGRIDDLEVEITNIHFYYDERMQERMLDWTNALESYYAASEQLEWIHSQIEGLHADNPDNLLLDEFILCDAESAMAAIQHAPFHNWIDIEKNDPEGILPVYKELFVRLNALRVDFNHSITNIDSLFFEYGLMHLPDTVPDISRDYFMSALAYNPFYIQSHLALARMDVEAGDKEASLDRLGHVIQRMHPAGEYKRQYQALTDTVLDLFYKEAQDLILERRFIESLRTLDHVVVFCGRAKGRMICPPLFSMLQRRTHLGIYESFLIVSGRALRDDNLSLAVTYIQSALAYQEEHSDQVREANDALDLLFQVLTRYRIMYELALILGQEEALAKYYVPGRDILDNHSHLYNHVFEQRDVSQMKVAVLNFAILGYPDKSISLLKQLKELNIEPSEVAYHQKVAGMNAAINLRDQEAGKQSGELFRQYGLNDPWFRTFRGSFVKHW